ncbi:MAG: ribosomal-protein-alanine N-acetyltransferase [Candidatus Goldiibacteriota bacterium HGW-Goldbacteria-1]|jgi:ribosomal-protein-alanine N-acetyltransferase|nr:MAG: ribosomal-protein-alanine N-acetyltransferase [Candidatus Goldiibacteriota bacterium HGW-Goldbacteria-1]
MDFYIKNVSKNDLAEILEIEKVCHARPWDEKAFNVEISKFFSALSFFFAARDKASDRLLGYIIADKIADYAHISNVAVAPEFRKNGIATGLLKQVERQVFAAGLSSLTLEVRENNEAALEMYKKFGYEIKGRRPKFYEDKYDGLIMWKRL